MGGQSVALPVTFAKFRIRGIPSASRHLPCWRKGILGEDTLLPRADVITSWDQRSSRATHVWNKCPLHKPVSRGMNSEQMTSLVQLHNFLVLVRLLQTYRPPLKCPCVDA